MFVRFKPFLILSKFVIVAQLRSYNIYDAAIITMYNNYRDHILKYKSQKLFLNKLDTKIKYHIQNSPKI